MSEKVTVTKEVAKAIEELRGLGRTNSAIIIKAVDDTPLESDAEWTLFNYVNGEGEDALISALINGYEFEKTPEDKVREYYEGFENCSAEHAHEYAGVRHGVRNTLKLLGIIIEGVNG